MVQHPHLRMRILAVVLALLAGLVTLGTFGLQVPANPLSAVRLDGPTVADSNGTITAIVDSESRRLLLLNKNRKLASIVSCNELNSPIDAITDVCVSGSTVFVAGVKYGQDSNLMERERVVTYDARGASKQIVYDVDTSDVQGYISIKSMDPIDKDDAAGSEQDENEGEDGIYVTRCNLARTTSSPTYVDILYASRNSATKVDEKNAGVVSVFDVGHYAKEGLLYTVSEQGEIGGGDQMTDEQKEAATKCIFTSIDVSDEGEPYLCDDITGNIYCMRNEGDLALVASGSGLGNIHINGDVLTVCNREANNVTFRSLTSSDHVALEAVSCAPSLVSLSITVIACRAYLIAFVTIALLLMLRSRLRDKNYEGIGPLFASTAVVFVVSLAIAYISYGSYQTLQNTRAKEINAFADYLEVTSGLIGKDMERCNDRSLFRSYENEDALVNLADVEVLTRTLAWAATQNGIDAYVKIYGRDDQGIFFLCDSTGEHVLGTSNLSSMNEEYIRQAFSTNSVDDELRTGRTLYDATQYRLVWIPNADNTATAGVIEIGSRLRTYEASIASEQIDRIIALLVMVLVVYLTYVELRSCAHCFVEYQRMKHHHDAVAVLTRPFSFFVTLLSSIDAVMTTLIARSMLSAAGMDTSGVLVALPSVTLGVGLVVGQAMYAVVGSRYLIRTLMKRGALFMAAAALITGGVVWVGSFWLYCAAKLVMAIPFGLLYTLSYSLPRRADSDEVRELAASGIKRTDTSAAALGTVLGGYVAQSLGNAWVYALVAFVSVIVYTLAANVMPRTRHPLEKESKRADSVPEALRKLLANKLTLLVIFFVMLPSTLASGYNSFMFPLFTADLGLSTSSINNLFVLGQLVVFVSIAAIEYLEEKLDKWRVTGTAVALLGAVFLLFSLNTSLVWAVVTIALVGVLCKATDGWKALWVRSAKARGLATGLATGEMFATRSVLLVVRPLLLGSLLSVSDITAIVVLGVMCAVCAVAFYITTRNTVLAPDDDVLMMEPEPESGRRA